MNAAEQGFAPRPETALGERSDAIVVADLGTLAYLPVLEQMRHFTASRDRATPDRILMLEHQPVFTLGQAGLERHLLDDGTGIPVFHVERGGQITYHGPGQVVAYTLIDLKRRAIKVREFVRLLEGAAIDVLESYNVEGFRKHGAPGIYVRWQGDLAKIAALGLKVKNGSTFHGLALNVDMDLAPFKAINPCGYEGLVAVDLKRLGVTARPDQVKLRLAQVLVRRIEGKDWS